MEEAQGEPDVKLEIIDRPVKEEDGHLESVGGEEGEKNGGGDKDEESNSGGGDTAREDSDDDVERWDENGDPTLPFVGSWDRPVLVCTAGLSCTEGKVEKIISSAEERNDKLLGEWTDMVNNNVTPLPAYPLPVLPEITTICVSKYKCYHQQYWTEFTSETSPVHPYFKPCVMMQVFSLRLSSPMDHPVNIYGTFSVRDSWEPLRNHLFNRSRDDPATIPEGCSFLPLRSPCRGIYLVQYFLMDVDLWIKEEGVGSADKPLFCGYVELDTYLSGFGSKFLGRFQGDCHGLDMHYTFLR